MNSSSIRPSLLLVLMALLGGDVLSAKESEVFFSPDDKFQKGLVRTLLGAKRSIDIAMYSFHPTSKQDAENYKQLKRSYEISALDALREAVSKGVKVRIVLNKATTDRWAKMSVKPLIDAGAQVYTTGETMHEKYAIIDGSRVINGSGNWSLGAFHRYHENWIIFPPDKKLAELFQYNMDVLLAQNNRVIVNKEGVPKLKKASKKKAPKNGKRGAGATSEVYFSTDNKGTKTTIVEGEIISWMRRAKKELLIAVAHFNTERLSDELIKAQQRGIKIRVMLDLGEYGNRRSRSGALHKAKIKVRYLTYSLKHHFPFAKLMHHKFMIVDGKTLLNGSYNWSRTAEHKNHENLQIFRGKKWKTLVDKYVAEFEHLWEYGRDRYPKFIKRMQAKKGSPNYRRYVPSHFPSMSLEKKEVAAVRRGVSKTGYFRRPKKGKKAAWEFWSFDREKKVGTNEFPLPPHKPFFDLEQLVMTEICYRPKKGLSGEFIEVYNGTKESIDLTRISLVDGDSKDKLVSWGKSKKVLKPGAVGLIIDPKFKDDFPIPSGICVVTVKDKSLGNGLSRGDVISLVDAQGKTRDSCELKAKTKPGQVIGRRSVYTIGHPDNWKPTSPSPGVHKAGKP